MVSKGILAADESTPTMKKRFDSIGVESTEESRREWRDILFTTPGLENSISGVIMFDETVRQSTAAGENFVEHLTELGIVPGIKVDKGAKLLPGFPGEKMTECLDGLRDRLAEYAEMGLRFAKWRAVLTVPSSTTAIKANAQALGMYAALCQEAGIVPIVEPEVLMEGTHDIDDAQRTTETALSLTFHALRRHRVDLAAMVLKPNMVMTGYDAKYGVEVDSAPIDVAANMMMETMMACVPALVPGIAFLSGGQSDEEAVEHLNEMSDNYLPWRITFSYGRALQGHPLKVWGGDTENRAMAQNALLGRARACFEAVT